MGDEADARGLAFAELLDSIVARYEACVTRLERELSHLTMPGEWPIDASESPVGGTGHT